MSRYVIWLLPIQQQLIENNLNFAMSLRQHEKWPEKVSLSFVKPPSGVNVG